MSSERRQGKEADICIRESAAGYQTETRRDAVCQGTYLGENLHKSHETFTTVNYHFIIICAARCCACRHAMSVCLSVCLSGS